jgi:hypothetical protein
MRSADLSSGSAASSKHSAAAGILLYSFHHFADQVTVDVDFLFAFFQSIDFLRASTEMPHSHRPQHSHDQCSRDNQDAEQQPQGPGPELGAASWVGIQQPRPAENEVSRAATVTMLTARVLRLPRVVS